MRPVPLDRRPGIEWVDACAGDFWGCRTWAVRYHIRRGGFYRSRAPFDPRQSGWHSRAVTRVLGLDVGSRTIGVAVTDELGFAAHGVTTIERKGTKRDVESVGKLVKEYGVTRIVVGMPYEIDGTIGQRGTRVKVFADALAALGCPVELWDERFSTVDATEALLEADVSRQKRKAVIDKVAAQMILRSWLDEQPQGH